MMIHRPPSQTQRLLFLWALMISLSSASHILSDEFRRSLPHQNAPDACSAIGLIQPWPVTGGVSACLAGQGVVQLQFQVTDPFRHLPFFTINLNDGNTSSLYSIQVASHAVTISNASGIVGPPAKMNDIHAASPWLPADLLDGEGSEVTMWVSFDKKNELLKFGFGYAMIENTIISVNASADTLRSIAVCSVSSATPSNYTTFLFPVVKTIPPVVLDSNSMTLEILSENTARVPGQLPPEAQSLFSAVAGNNIQLSNSDALAIDYCVKTPGCFLYEKLKEKSGEFGGGDANMVYVRVTIGPDMGDSPGSPYVMEIWPPGCHSPIHDHANSVAVIKVLYGDITSSWYNPLSLTGNSATLTPIKTATFQSGDITYITPDLWQTHQLKNEGDVTCVTIQSYQYLDSDYVHYETFDYISEDLSLHFFAPDSDFEYLDFIAQARAAYQARSAGTSTAASGLSAGAIAGITVGSVAAVVVLVVLVWRFRRGHGYQPT